MTLERDLTRAAWVIAEARAGLPMAAPRDASCYNYPSTGNGPRSHAGGKYHAVGRDGQARCSRRLLVLELARPAGELDPVLLCRRTACAAAFTRAAP